VTQSERIEVLIIAATAPIGWFVWPHIFAPMPIWQIVLGLSALLLAQSLVRDTAIIIRSRYKLSGGARKEAQCFCVESTVGSMGVAVGALLAGLGGSSQVAFGPWSFVAAATGTMMLGFLIKDLIITWKPFGVRREKDHLNLVVRWTNKSS
jgi:hypothetical protein